jgi:peptidoglycan/LPS O-acetylase OafA/YrhL
MTDAVATTAPPAGAALAAQPVSALFLGIDVFRGVAVALVVVLHASGAALPALAEGSTSASTLALWMQFLNRALQFVVPAFLLISAALLTHSLLARPDLGRYFKRRVGRGAWPYLLWSVIFICWYVWRGERPAEELSDPSRWLFYLGYGKASFHLYFLLVALELYLVLPLLLPLARRRPSIGVTLLTGLGLQGLAYVLNATLFDFRFPASTLLWYLAPVILGVGIGARLGEFQGWWRRRRVWWLAGLAISAALYLPQGLALIGGQEVVTWAYSLSHWLYSTLASVALLALSLRLARVPRLGALLAGLGVLSMPVYLLHPIVIQLLGDLGFPGGLGAFLGVFGVMILVSLSLPWLIGRAVQGTRFSDVLFGRS